MDCGWSTLSSDTLPGAWCSTWTLSERPGNWTEPQETTNSPTRLRASKLLQDEGNSNLALRDISSSKGSIASHSANPNICGDAHSDSYLSEEDSESVQSDDFYSFISQEDPDITLSPSVTTPRTLTKSAEKISSTISSIKPDFDLTGLNSNLHLPTQRELSDDVHSEVPVPPSPHPSETSFDPPASSSSSSRQVDSTSSRNGDHSGRASIQSNFSGSNFELGIRNLADRLDRLESFIASQGSADSRNNLSLSQPDGNNPWTLSLEPTLSLTQSVASTTSLSAESSSASEGRYPSEIFQRQPELEPFELHSPSLDQPPSVNNEAAALFHPPSGLAVEASPPERRPTGPQASHTTINHRNELIRSRNVIQKTKEFCSKFKRFITSKSSKSKNEINLSATGAYTLVDVDAQPHGHDYPRLASRLSLQRPRGFIRRAKVSSPSGVLPENPSYGGETAVDDRHSYDYHGRPKALQEIRSGRRVSLPAFYRASTPVGTPARTNASLVTLQRKEGRMG